MQTPAFDMLHAIIGDPVSLDHHLYKAPHAYRGTPPRLRRGKAVEFVHNKTTGEAIVKRRLFKGHRP